jgi:hypothetical protein
MYPVCILCLYHNVDHHVSLLYHITNKFLFSTSDF